MNTWLIRFLLTLVIALCFPVNGSAAEDKSLTPETRCAVCGMFVAKYPEWVCRITMSDGAIKHFDGVKDMMAFSFTPQKYGAKTGATPVDYEVKDYYTLAPVDGKKALYVVGSDTTGPMGEELIPFAAKDAAEAFRLDHHGTKILPFTMITSELIEALRTGQTMK